MELNQKKKIVLELLDTFDLASKVALDLRKKGLNKKIKDDNTPVTNGDIEVNNILTKKILDLTPDIPIISEETVDNKKKNLDFSESISYHCTVFRKASILSGSSFNKFGLPEVFFVKTQWIRNKPSNFTIFFKTFYYRIQKSV